MIERIPDLRHHFLGHIAGLKDQLYNNELTLSRENPRGEREISLNHVY